MDEKVRKYRKRYKKCLYCKYLSYVNSKGLCCSDGYYVCKAKDKVILSNEMLRPFCSCFELYERMQ